MSGGDFELCSRVIKNSKEIYYEPDAKIYHHYPSSILTFMRKRFINGKWNGIIRKLYKKKLHIKSKSYLDILRIYGFMFVIFRFLEDISFRSGLIVAYLLRK